MVSLQTFKRSTCYPIQTLYIIWCPLFSYELLLYILRAFHLSKTLFHLFSTFKWLCSVTGHRCVLLITKDVRDNDRDEGGTSDLCDHGDRGSHGSGCRCSVLRAPRDGGNWKDKKKVYKLMFNICLTVDTWFKFFVFSVFLSARFWGASCLKTVITKEGMCEI